MTPTTHRQHYTEEQRLPVTARADFDLKVEQIGTHSTMIHLIQGDYNVFYESQVGARIDHIGGFVDPQWFQTLANSYFDKKEYYRKFFDTILNLQPNSKEDLEAKLSNCPTCVLILAIQDYIPQIHPSEINHHFVFDIIEYVSNRLIKALYDPSYPLGLLPGQYASVLTLWQYLYAYQYRKEQYDAFVYELANLTFSGFNINQIQTETALTDENTKLTQTLQSERKKNLQLQRFIAQIKQDVSIVVAQMKMGSVIKGALATSILDPVVDQLHKERDVLTRQLEGSQAAISARDQEIQRLREQIAWIQSEKDESATELREVKQERDEFARQIQEWINQKPEPQRETPVPPQAFTYKYQARNTRS